MGDEQTGLGGIKHALCGVDELTDLQRCRPHRALSARNRRIAVSIVEHFVGDERAAEAEEPQPDAADVEAACRRLVEHMEVLDIVLASTELLEHDDVLARAPDGVDRHLELDLARQEEGELGQKGYGHRGADCRRGVFRREEMIPLRGGDEWRIHCEVAEGAVIYPVEAGGLCRSVSVSGVCRHD